MAVVLDVITDALRELGVLAAGEVATADEAMSGLDALNRLIDQWAAERLSIYQSTRTTWTISTSTQNYTVGTGATINRLRPMSIDHVSYYDSAISPVSEVPLDELTDDAWAGVTQKSATADAPIQYYYSPTMATGTLSLWPIPTSSTLIGVMYAPTAVSEYTSLATAVSLPPGYRRMIVKNLALELSPSYSKPASQELREQALDSKLVVKRSNRRLVDRSFDPGLLQGWS